jgi:hypothetical protein
MKQELENLVYSEPCLKKRFFEPFVRNKKSKIVYYKCILEFNFDASLGP